LDIHNEMLDLYHFQQLKQRLRKLWHETRDPAYKTKSLTKRDSPKTPIGIHGPSDLKFLPLEIPLPTAWKISSHHVTCVRKTMNGEWKLMSRLSEALDNGRPPSPHEIVKPCDVQNLINSLKLRQACVTDGIPNECLRHFPRRPFLSSFLGSIAQLRPWTPPQNPAELLGGYWFT
jgi:hypothetical protein